MPPSHLFPQGTPELSDTALTLIAARFRALGEPMRLRLLHALMAGPRRVGQLVELTQSSQANISKHLAVLRDAGMVSMRKVGPSTLCSVAEPALYELCSLMCSQLQRDMAAKAEATCFDPSISLLLSPRRNRL